MSPHFIGKSKSQGHPGLKRHHQDRHAAKCSGAVSWQTAHGRAWELHKKGCRLCPPLLLLLLLHTPGLGVGSGGVMVLGAPFPGCFLLTGISFLPLQNKVERKMGTVVKFGRKSEACFSFGKHASPLPGSVPPLFASLAVFGCWQDDLGPAELQ